MGLQQCMASATVIATWRQSECSILCQSADDVCSGRSTRIVCVESLVPCKAARQYFQALKPYI
jgi:hypothetical protein